MDDLEDKLGKQSRYQTLSVFAASVMIYASTSAGQAAIFYNAVPKHRCRLPFDDGNLFPNVTEEDIQLAIPPGESCHRYAFNWTACSAARDLTCLANATEAGTMECDNGYHYDDTHYASTVVTEWNLVCKDRVLESVVTSLYFMGVFFGSLAAGQLSDWFGRKFNLLVLSIFITISGLACSFAPTFAVYCTFRFIEGAASVPGNVSAFSYGNEMASRRSRRFAGICLISANALCHTLLPLKSFFLPNWRHLNLLAALIPITFLMMYPFISESPRWLLVKGKMKEAKKVLERIAKSKGKTITNEDWETMLKKEKEKAKDGHVAYGFVDLFRQPFTRVVTFVSVLTWFSVTAIYYGLSLNVGTLTGKPHLNAALNGLTEVIALVVYAVLVSRVGPRVCLVTGMGVSGVLCLSAVVAKQFDGPVALQVVRWASISGKLFTTISFDSAYQYTNDVYPTATRGVGTGLSSSFGRLGSMCMPFLLYAQYETVWVTDAVFGSLGILVAAACLILPSTPTTLVLMTTHEAEQFYGEDMRFVAKCLGRTVHKKETVSYRDGEECATSLVHSKV